MATISLCEVFYGNVIYNSFETGNTLMCLIRNLNRLHACSTKNKETLLLDFFYLVTDSREQIMNTYLYVYMVVVVSTSPLMIIERSPNRPKGYVDNLSIYPAKESLIISGGLSIGPGPSWGCICVHGHRDLPSPKG